MSDIIAYPNNSFKEIAPANGYKYTFIELQKLVEGHIQALWLGNHRLMVFNAEGKIQGMKMNSIATAWARERIILEDYIVGPAILMDADHLD